MTAAFGWPHAKKIAVTITVLLETWSEGKAAPYSIQTTSLRPGSVDYSGIAWGEYGGNEGIWRIMRILDRYIVREVFRHALLGLAVFTFVFFVPQLVRLMELRQFYSEL